MGARMNLTDDDWPGPGATAAGDSDPWHPAGGPVDGRLDDLVDALDRAIARRKVQDTDRVAATA